MIKMQKLFAVACAALLSTSMAAPAQDKLKLAIGQRGNWEQSVPELGQKQGIFKKHGLELELLYTQGGGETQQAVISGSVDIGLGVGLGGVMGAFSKGAPVRIIGNAMQGGFDVFWYVRADSPIKTMKDADGKTIAFSTNGSSTNIMALGLAKTFGVNAKATATGGAPATFTQVMSGQIDIGWSSPPFAVDAIEQGRIRAVARGSDVPNFKTQTLRVQIANLGALQAKKEVFARFMRAYRESLDWMYTGDEAVKMYANWLDIPLNVALKTREEFFPKANQDPDRIADIDVAVTDAVAYKFLSAPLTKQQLDELIVLQPK